MSLFSKLTDETRAEVRKLTFIAQDELRQVHEASHGVVALVTAHPALFVAVFVLGTVFGWLV